MKDPTKPKSITLRAVMERPAVKFRYSDVGEVKSIVIETSLTLLPHRGKLEPTMDALAPYGERIFQVTLEP